MSRAEMIQRMILRSQKADKLVEFLHTEINMALSQQRHTEEIDSLKREQDSLKKEVSRLVNKLNILEGREPVVTEMTPKVITDKEVKLESKKSLPANKKDDDPKHKKQKLSEDQQKGDGKIESKKGGKVQAKKGAEEESSVIDVSRLDFRVGRILEAKKHPDADSLYVESVDVGEEKPRTVVSGLVKFVPLQEMQNKLAVLLCNLKPVKMRGVTSEAMVMCASTPDKVEVLNPPQGSLPGDLVTFQGFPRNPDPILNPKKKIFETVAPDLKTDNDKVATYKGVPFTVEGKGVVTAPTLANVNVK